MLNTAFMMSVDETVLYKAFNASVLEGKIGTYEQASNTYGVYYVQILTV